ncbi:hypothetical protein [Ktedonospora formicarum]|uniref:SWIM-type domain-containing protein n=1 Tax=Ktedonospora formicarum TaxID=2778364 RepID=A0A8J3N071_9CHLR|nr:hypothetical protein [Ktedonospora formicarum]GHO51515.1 hypothetical protein KSX_96780 [Ktedonospora formicarum]
MAVMTASRIDTSKVTDEQIGRAYKCFESNGTPFYMVESSRDLFDGEGKRVEYKVTWSKQFGFQCTCEAGKYGFKNCQKGVCQHVIISVAAAREERAAMKELNAKPVQREDVRKAAIKARAKALVAEPLNLSDEDKVRFGLN